MQVDINEKMRAILIDWLVEVHLKFKVGMQTQQWQQWPHQRVWRHLACLQRSRRGGGTGRDALPLCIWAAA